MTVTTDPTTGVRTSGDYSVDADGFLTHSPYPMQHVAGGPDESWNWGDAAPDHFNRLTAQNYADMAGLNTDAIDFVAAWSGPDAEGFYHWVAEQAPGAVTIDIPAGTTPIVVNPNLPGGFIPAPEGAATPETPAEAPLVPSMPFSPADSHPLDDALPLGVVHEVTGAVGLTTEVNSTPEHGPAVVFAAATDPAFALPVKAQVVRISATETRISWLTAFGHKIEFVGTGFLHALSKAWGALAH